MNILILEDEPRNAKRLIRLLNDIDRTFIVEGPLASIKETVEFFQSGKTTNLILADIRLTDGLSFEALKAAFRCLTEEQVPLSGAFLASLP